MPETEEPMGGVLANDEASGRESVGVVIVELSQAPFL